MTTDFNLTSIGELSVAITGIVALVTGGALMIAFSRAMSGSEGATRHFAGAVRWISAAYVCRSAYRDVLPSIATDAAWAAWMDKSGDFPFNILWSGAFIWGAYHGLRGLHLTIPADERHEWRWWSSWMYPPWHSIGHLRQVAAVARANRRLRRSKIKPPKK